MDFEVIEIEKKVNYSITLQPPSTSTISATASVNYSKTKARIASTRTYFAYFVKANMASVWLLKSRISKLEGQTKP